jgi:ABC-type nitrate/sulfonate/bicarbonate transport system ATPase subunit
MEAQPDGAVLGALRRKIAAQLESHEYESAVFLADKLVSMSNGAEDVSVHRPRACHSLC